MLLLFSQCRNLIKADKRKAKLHSRIDERFFWVRLSDLQTESEVKAVSVLDFNRVTN